MNFSALTVPQKYPSKIVGALAVLVVAFSVFVFSPEKGQSTICSENEIDAILVKQGPTFLKEFVWQKALLFPVSCHSKIRAAEELAYGLRRRGRYAEAANLQERALIARRRIYGIDIGAVFCMTELAWIYEDQGDFNRAEKIFKEALKESESALGRQHQYTDRLCGCLAYLLERQGRYTESEFFNLRRLEFLGGDDNFSLKNLARVYARAGKYSESECLFKKLIGNPSLQVFGYETDLALLYQQQKRYREAESLLKQQVQKYSSGTPSAPYVRASLACLYKEMGDFKSAETLLKKVLNEVSATPWGGSDWMRSELADLYKQQGRYEDAEQLYSKLIKVKQKHFGEWHPNAALSIDDLGHLFESEGRYLEAEGLFKKALQIRLKMLCKEHPDVGESFRNLSVVCNIQGRFRESADYYQESLTSYRQCLSLRERRIDTERP